MILRNVAVPDGEEPVSIEISNDGTIGRVGGGMGGGMGNAGVDDSILFDGAIAFPGLINSHDHLDFNTFPRLGNRVYDHYVPWGEDIHAVNAEVIAQVLRVPVGLRVQWSLYKNLLNGITTVVQHGPRFDVDDTLIDVFEDCRSIHSVRLEKRWKLRLNKPGAGSQPVVIHIGEGVNEAAKREIDELIRWNLLKRPLIGIHGVSMSTAQARSFKALVWCPDSNFFLFRKTADLPALKRAVPLLFGTDSTLTAHWDIWSQLRIAMSTGFVTGPELYRMLTASPATVWGMTDKGALRHGAVADIIIARQKDRGFIPSFLACSPEDILLVLHRGEIRMFDESLLPQLDAGKLPLDQYTRIGLRRTSKYVYGDLPRLMDDIREFYPQFDVPGIHTA